MVPVLPESAPFTEGQRAWLNGFLAGLLSMAATPGAGRPGAAAPAAAAAAATATPAAGAPAAAADEPWHDPDLPLDERLARAEGRPLGSRLAACMAQLDCHACGYDCRSYAAALAGGTERKVTLCSPGGPATAAKLRELLAAGAGPAPAAPVPSKPAAPPPKQGAKAEPARAPRFAFGARLLWREALHGPGAATEAIGLVLDVSEAEEAFEVGDGLGIFPENPAEEVEASLAALGATGRERVVTAAGRAVALRIALAEDWDLRDLHQVLAARGARPAPADVARELGRLKPRLYTLASSPRLHPGEAHLTVARVPGGLASGFLAGKLAVGRSVRAFRNPGRLRLPKDGSTPLVMIGAGAGIAPYRAFLQERQATGARGFSWLLFGGEREEGDYLYRTELEGYLAEGVLTRLDTAFPLDATPGVGLGAKVRACGAEIWSWLEKGAHLYLSGDARRMAPEVEEALRQAVAEHGKRAPSDAKAYLAALAKEGRYLREIY